MRRLSAVVVPLLFVLGACTGGPEGTPTPTSTTGSAPPVERVYVSLGDSYASGYRPADGGAPAGTTRDGFAYVVAKKSGLRLINVGCSGATSASLRQTADCQTANRGPGAPDPGGKTQLDAALAALRDNQNRVGLVTIVIGGNDLFRCAKLDAQAALTCATGGMATLQSNLAEVLPKLREAAGDAPIVGLTYPDVFLGAWAGTAFPNGKDIARMSVPLFRDYFNKTLRAEYEKIGATFVDITELTGGYGPLTEITQDPTYGPIPTPVAKICELTYFCSLADVHPTTAGHEAIAAAVLKAVDE